MNYWHYFFYLLGLAPNKLLLSNDEIEKCNSIIVLKIKEFSACSRTNLLNKSLGYIIFTQSSCLQDYFIDISRLNYYNNKIFRPFIKRIR